MGARGSLSGILNVDKPSGMTSHDVVLAVRRLTRQRRVGHAGTLDPLATGVLLVCLGQATRVCEYLMRSPKEYRADVHLGVTTTTHDAEGEIVRRSEAQVTRRMVEQALQGFVGRVPQVPPRYSAIRQRGKRLYELARQGIEVDVAAREVDIYALSIVAWTPPVVRLDVRCGPGTYVRALARDLGEVLGCGAHLSALRRTSSGDFAVSEATSLDRLRQAAQAEAIAELLHPLDAAFAHLPALHLGAEDAQRLALGQWVRVEADPGNGTQARVYGPDGQFVALVTLDQDTGLWRPRKVFADPREMIPVRSDRDVRTDQ